MYDGVAGVGHDNAAIGADGDSMRILELPGAAAKRPEQERVRAVGMMHADIVIGGGRHYNAAVGADGDRPRPICHKIERERAVGIECLDAVTAGVTHNDHARIGLHGMRVAACRRWDRG